MLLAQEYIVYVQLHVTHKFKCHDMQEKKLRMTTSVHRDLYVRG